MRLLISCLSIFLFLITTSHSVIADENQYFIQSTTQQYLTDSDKFLHACCTPLKFTREGIQHFLQDIFNRTEYVKVYLPHNIADHFYQFLDYGKTLDQKAEYLQSTLRLFNNKVKQCMYISGDAYSKLIEELPHHINPYITQSYSLSHLTELKSSIIRIIYSSIANISLSSKNLKHDEKDIRCKKELNQCSHQLDEILKTLNNGMFINEQVTREHMQQTLVRFLETSLNKVIWSPFDYTNAWISTKQIAHNLNLLTERNIITQEDLDDLYQSLIQRFIHFLHLTGSDLSLDMTAEIKQDIADGKILLLTLEEQEEFIETKATRLLDAVRTTEAKILARPKGIVTGVRITT